MVRDSRISLCCAVPEALILKLQILLFPYIFGEGLHRCWQSSFMSCIKLVWNVSLNGRCLEVMAKHSFIAAIVVRARKT